MSDTERTQINGLEENRYLATVDGDELTIIDEQCPEAWIAADEAFNLDEVR